MVLQVIGRGEFGAFVLPGLYLLSGARSAAAVSLDAQRRQYVQRHQVSRSVGGTPITKTSPPPDLSYESGRFLLTERY
jgi:hypothetical protein